MSGFINEQGRDSSIFLIVWKKVRKKSLEATLDYIWRLFSELLWRFASYDYWGHP